MKRKTIREMRLYRFRLADGRLASGGEIDYGGRPAGYGLAPQENVVYVSAHDNETLFDAIQLKAAPRASIAERVRMQKLGLSLVLLAQGVPFIHAGDEILRSKSLDRNSYDSGDWWNAIDWSYETNGWAKGLPPGENRRNWPLLAGLLADPRLRAGREDILEFLLTSHPLDCPICDKGGECPLQNLTMGFGPGESRYLCGEKMHLAKHVPLGELIYLDRERCIQCGRCVRFQEIVAEDPVIGFFNRGRRIEIVSYSEPGFNSYWSGNTTDICPVGALTTADFRFGARPWELKAAASLCIHCPVGCNTTLNIRREAADALLADGRGQKNKQPKRASSLNKGSTDSVKTKTRGCERRYRPRSSGPRRSSGGGRRR